MRYIAIKKVRKMTAKERIEQIKGRAKVLGLALTFGLGGKSAAAKAMSLPRTDPNIAPTEISITPENGICNDDTLAAKRRLIKAEREFASVAKSGKYKGLLIDYETMQAQDIGHIFESSMDPTAYTGKYIGWYQMSLAPGGLMQQFVKAYGKKYPNLVGLDVKTTDFRKNYNAYATGANKAQFEKDLFNFNYDKVYAKIFNQLARNIKDFPTITKDNCNDPQYKALAGAIMSCANQSPAKTHGIFKNAWNTHLARTKFNPNDVVSALEFYGKVIETSYGIRQSKWGLSSRYKEEKKLAAELLRYIRGKELIKKVKSQSTNAGKTASSENIAPDGNNLKLAYTLINQRGK